MDPIIIVGDSPFLKEVEDKVPYVLDRYYSIGINSVISKFKTSAHAFQDMQVALLTSKFSDIKAITISAHGALVKKDNKEFFNSYSFDVNNNTERDIIKDGKLAWCGFTHDYAISYCILKGYKDIVLLGSADFEKGGHYSNVREFKYSEVLKENSKKFIENFCSKRANIYTCNPDSILSVKRISVDDLLK